jgi:hypothetical protein
VGGIERDEMRWCGRVRVRLMVLKASQTDRQTDRHTDIQKEGKQEKREYMMRQSYAS